MPKKLTDAFAALSIRTKLICVFVLTILVMLLVNVFMYLNINKITVQLDEIYADNVRLNAIADALDGLQSSMTSYLNTKTTDAMEEYYKNEQNYADLIAGLRTKATGDELLLMERNIHYMSETYLTLTADTIEAKRGRNVEKYKAYYDDASQLYGYLQMYILSLNNRRFRTNTGDYEVLSDSLQYLEMVSIFIFIALTLCTLLMVVMFTRNITKPLRKLSDAAYRVANGELDQADMVEVHSMDEIGVVTVAFNRMLQSIPAYINRLRESLEKERQMKEKELLMETHLKDAQLKYLQAQINPHFLFNSLNAGAQLAMMESADRTYDYIQNMAAFFRYNIKKDHDEVTLEEEIRLVDNYIYILDTDGNIKDTVILNNTDEKVSGNISAEFYGGDERCLLIGFSTHDIKGLELSEEEQNLRIKLEDEVFKNKKGFVDVNVSAILDKSQIGSGNITLEPVTPE